MARTVYIRDEDRAMMEKNKPTSWPLVDYLGFLASLHNDMDECERAQRQYDYQRYLAAKRVEPESIRQADAGEHETAQEFMARLGDGQCTD